MKQFFSIVKLFFKIKLIFKEPKNYKLIIFDEESIIDFKNVIKGKDYFVVKDRIAGINAMTGKGFNELYISLRLIKFFIKNYRGNLMTAYLASLLEIIKPRAVVTFIDNSEKFSDLAKVLNKKMQFIAIQNAYRTDILENHYLFKKKLKKTNPNKYLFIPNLLCLGQHNVEFYKKLKIKTKNIKKVGSLRLANALEYFKKKKITFKNYKYDICVISDTTQKAHFKGLKRDEAKTAKYLDYGIANTVKYAIKFCIKYNKKFIFVSKSKKKNNINHKNELNFYKKYLTKKEFSFLISNTTNPKASFFNSYFTMFQSKVTTSTISTMLGENLALGNKILACNLTKISILDFPIKGICSVKNCHYNEYEKKLLNILSITNKKYFSKLTRKKDYLISYDKKKSTIEIIKKNLEELIR